MAGLVTLHALFPVPTVFVAAQVLPTTAVAPDGAPGTVPLAVTELVAAEAGPVPTALVAVTLKV